MSQDPKVANPKIAETAFWDDAGFLSWLGISFDSPPVIKQPAKEEIETTVVEEVTEKEEIVSPEKDKYNNEDIVPTFKEARVISKWGPEMPKERKKVKTKEKVWPTKEDAVWQLIQQRS